jgi:hypothetical protein
MLFILSGFIMFVSHRYFAVDAPVRRVRKHRSLPSRHHSAQTPTEIGLGEDDLEEDQLAEVEEDPVGELEEFGTDHHRGTDGMAGDGKDANIEDGLDGIEEELESEGEKPHGQGEVPRGHDAAAGSSTTPQPSVVGGGSSDSGTMTADVIVSAAETSLVAYPTAETEFECTRKLDYIVAPTSTPWPTNCAGREELCDVVRRTAIDRQALVAVCNSGIISQLSKWVESNRRANISNMIIIAIDSQLPKWLEENRVAYWRRSTSAAGSHKISAQKFGWVRTPPPPPPPPLPPPPPPPPPPPSADTYTAPRPTSPPPAPRPPTPRSQLRQGVPLDRLLRPHV